MADAPPPIAGSSLQAGFLANEISKDREARRTGETHAARRQSATVTETGDTVETADSDARVFSDAEGGGSQGRAFEETTPQGTSDGTGAPTETGHSPRTPPPILDLQA